MPALSMSLDPASVAGLHRALAMYVDKVKHTHAYCCNRTALNVAFRAAQFTPKAKKSDITGSMRDPRAVMVSQLRKAGLPIPSGFTAVVEKMINRRVSSIAFIKAGWIPAAKALTAVVRQGALSISARPFGRNRPGLGGVHIASGITDVYAEIWNTSINPKDRTSAAALEKYGKPALEHAMSFVAADMIAFVTETEKPIAAEFNRK